MLSTGDIIDGKYRIIRLIGEGGMGSVYEGENTRIHRRVAIKVLHSGVAETAEAVQRFEREAQAAGRIGSEHIVEVLDLGNLPSGDRYMVMEFMDGDSLSDRIRQRGRIPPAELCPLALQLLEGLGAAHTAGIIHRDLKPDNVYLLKSRSGVANFVKLLDFGISKFNQLSGDSGFSMTRTGAVMGTPYYMAPEQAKGAKDMDHRVDLYATGVILYESVTGEVPFNADTFNELLFKIVLEEPRPVEQLVPDIDPNFAALINKAMARDPAQRFQTAKDFQAALTKWAAGGGAELANALRVPSKTPNPDSTGTLPRQTPQTAQVAPMLSTGTPGSWSNTGSTEVASAPRKSKSGLWLAAATLAVLAIGGGALGMQHAKHASADPAPSADPHSADEQARLERERIDAEKAKADADNALAAAERAKLDADKQVAAAALPPPSAETPAAKAAAVRPVVGRPASVAKAKETAAEKPPAPAPAAPPPPTPANTGRKIRTSL
jgi:serine/threonine-protein kinase